MQINKIDDGSSDQTRRGNEWNVIWQLGSSHRENDEFFY